MNGGNRHEVLTLDGPRLRSIGIQKQPRQPSEVDLPLEKLIVMATAYVHQPADKKGSSSESVLLIDSARNRGYEKVYKKGHLVRGYLHASMCS